MKSLQGKIVLLTGASRGLGVYFARELANRGARLALTARSESELNKLVEELRKDGGEAVAIPFDLTRTDRLQELLDKTKELLGPPDVLFNNAGRELYRTYPDYTREDIEGIIQLNVTVPMELTRLALPHMLEQKSGHILTVASIAGKKSSPYNSIYSGSKGAIVVWSDALRAELRGSGVGITVSCPTYVGDAGMFADTQMKPPFMMGTTPEKTARLSVKGILRNTPEVIVYNGPIRPMLALGQISPRLADAVVRWMGVVKLHKKFAEQETARSKNS